MRKLTSSLILVALALCTLSPLGAQSAKVNSTGGSSPHETTSTKIDGNRVVLVYGRPNAKSPKTGEMRKIWGSLVPYGKIWRLGSDEATLLITQKDIVLGGAPIAAGAYSLFLQPEADGSAKLIVNKNIGQWGIDPYDASKELVRIDLKKSDLTAPVDQFTMSVKKDPAGGGVLSLAWESTQYSVGYTVKK